MPTSKLIRRALVMNGLYLVLAVRILRTCWAVEAHSRGYTIVTSPLCLLWQHSIHRCNDVIEKETVANTKQANDARLPFFDSLWLLHVVSERSQRFLT